MGYESHDFGASTPRRTDPMPVDLLHWKLRAGIAQTSVGVMKRVRDGLKELPSYSANEGPAKESAIVMPAKDDETRARVQTLHMRIINGLRNLDGPAPAAAAAAPLALEAAAVVPPAAAPEPANLPNLPTFEERPLFSPDATMVVSDQVRPSARPEPPVRPSKVLEAAMGSAAPGSLAADPSEVTRVISDQSQAPYIPPLQTPAETTYAFGDDPSHAYVEGHQDPGYVEPLPQLAEHADLGQQGAWVLPEHVGHSVVTGSIEDLPSDSLPGPADAWPITDRVLSYNQPPDHQ